MEEATGGATKRMNDNAVIAHMVAQMPSPSSQAEVASLFSARRLRFAAVLFCAALATVMTLQVLFGISPFGVSSAPHYVYQAQSILDGRWDLTQASTLHDTIHLHGKTYMVYPPFPALLMLPFVALFGAHTSDIFITTCISALNLPLMYVLFEQARMNKLTARSSRDNLIISLFLYFGSINLYLSLGGEVWFTAQIICLTGSLAALLLALRRQYAWSALALSCAFLTRATMALGFPLILYLAWQDMGSSDGALEHFVRSLLRRKPDWQAIPWRRLIPPASVALFAVAIYLLRNALVFGSPLESGFGIQDQQDYPQITHGMYSLAYLPRNFIVNFLDIPQVTFDSAFALSPHLNLVGDGIGISVFVTTPLFLFLFARQKRMSKLQVALYATTALIVLETLLFAGTGWYQFGARYLFDAYPYAFLLLVLSERPLDWRFIALGIFGLFINPVGARQFWT